LKELATELSGVSIFDKIQLNTIDASISYCVSNIKEVYSGQSETSDLNSKMKNIEAESKDLTYQWCYKNVEQFLPNTQRQRKRTSFQKLTQLHSDRTVNENDLDNILNNSTVSESRYPSSNITTTNETFSIIDHKNIPAITVETSGGGSIVDDLEELLKPPITTKDSNDSIGLLIKI